MKALKEIINSVPADDSIALLETDSSFLSYKNLQLEWDRLHSFFIEKNLQGQKMGIYCKKKKNTIVSIGASLLYEIVYLPIDAYGSSIRNKKIIEQAGINAIITDDESLVTELNTSVHIQYKMDSFSIYILDVTKNDNLPDNTAYILHTSGSTGLPKGVLISHANAICFIDWCIDEFKIPHRSKMVSIAPFHFDLSVFDLFVALKSQSSLLLIDQPLLANPRLVANLLYNGNIDLIYATPSFYINLYSFGKLKPDTLSQIKLCLFAGEEFPISKFKLFKKFLSNAKLYNLYGPTESNVAAFALITIDDEKNVLPIGKSCPYNEVILIENELYISGPNLAAGYLNDALLTSQKFVNQNEKIWYKTGDYAEYNEIGQFVFKGRKDRMLKRNGYRIELDEIQNIFSGLKGIDQAAIVGKNEKERIIIIAFYSSLTSLNQIELRKEFLQNLPHYMMPDLFIQLSQIPITNSGKIDYQQLSNLEPLS